MIKFKTIMESRVKTSSYELVLSCLFVALFYICITISRFESECTTSRHYSYRFSQNVFEEKFYQMFKFSRFL